MFITHITSNYTSLSSYLSKGIFDALVNSFIHDIPGVSCQVSYWWYHCIGVSLSNTIFAVRNDADVNAIKPHVSGSIKQFHRSKQVLCTHLMS